MRARLRMCARQPWVAHLILVAAAALRFHRLGGANLWWDEALAVWAVRKGLVGVTLWTAGDVHPPLYFWSLWAWAQCVGESEFALRTLSALLGVLTVAVVYRLGVHLGGAPVGALAALLTGLARFHIWWSQELRMYVLAGLAGTASLALFLRWLRASTTAAPTASRTRPVRLLWPYALSSITALYSVLLMGALLLAQNVVVALRALWPGRRLRARALGHWILAQFAIVAALGGWLALSWGRMRTWSAAEAVSPGFALRLYLALLTTGVSEHIERLAVLAALPLALVPVGAWCLVRGRAKGQGSSGTALWEMLALVLASSFPVVAIYAATLPRGLFYTPHIEARYFLPFAPAFWALLAWCTILVIRRWRLAGAAAALSLVAIWLAVLPGYYKGRFLQDELQTMVRAILSQAEPDDAVILDSGSRYPVFLYHYQRVAGAGVRPPVQTVSQSEDPLQAGEVDRAMERLAADGRRVWLAEVDVRLTDPERLVARWLDERYPAVLKQGYGPNTLTLYDAEGDAPSVAPDYAPQHPLNAPVGETGLLRGWELPVSETTGPGAAYVSLLWERGPTGPVSVELVDEKGRLLLSQGADEAEGRENWRQQVDFPLAASTPSGLYRLRLSAEGSTLPLGTLRIADTAPLPVGEPDQPYALRVGEHILFEGYRLRDAQGRRPGAVSPGDTLTLDLFWRAEAKLVRDYTVFTHLLGGAHNPRTQGPVWGQHDSQPAEGGYPTTQWLVGDRIADRHRLVVDAAAPPGPYRIEVGMYTVEDGARLTVAEPGGQPLGDQIVLGVTVEVRAPR